MHVFLLFSRFDKEHLVKDVFLFPYYIAKELKAELDICCDLKRKEIDFKNYVVNTHDLNLNGASHASPYSILKQCLFLYKNRKKIDFLVLFHYRWYSVLLGAVYKLIRRDGVLYIKSDMPYDEAKKNFTSSNKLSVFFKKIIYSKGAKYIDAVSFETSKVYNCIRLSEDYSHIHNKALFIPNGYVEVDNKNKRHNKENIFLTVSRLGVYQKNTELLLEVIELLDLKDWRFYFLGAIQPSFHEKIEGFFIRNPNLIDKVFFEGNIEDLEKKNDFYEKAKVFVLPSRFESYGLVLLEAAAFDNYLISTDVGAINDLIDIFNCKGEVLCADVEVFRTRLQDIIDNDVVEVFNELQSLRMNSLAKQIVDFTAQKKIEISHA